MYAASGEFVQSIDTRLDGLQFLFGYKVQICCQGSGVETGNKDGFRFVFRFCQDAVRTLFQASPKTALKQQVANLFTGCFFCCRCFESNCSLLFVVGNSDFEQFALFSSDHFSHRTADG